jgi:putative transposase
LEFLTERKELSRNRACKILKCSRNNVYYQKLMPIKDEPVKEAIKASIGVSRRGRMKVIRLVQKKHPEFGSSRIRRVYEQNGFSLQKKLKRRVKNNPANPISIPIKRNIEWGVDFMSDALTDGRRIRTFNIVEHFNRECLGINVSRSIPAVRVIEYLERAIEKHGTPIAIRSDNGPEFTSKVFQLWMKEKKIRWSKIAKGAPQQNAIVERFNRTYREDVLDANLFYTVDHAQAITDQWMEEYNTVRPHQSLNQQTPKEYAA